MGLIHRGGRGERRGKLFAAKEAKGADEDACGELYEADMLVEGRVLVEDEAIRVLAPWSSNANPGRIGRQLPDRMDRMNRMNGTRKSS